MICKLAIWLVIGCFVHPTFLQISRSKRLLGQYWVFGISPTTCWQVDYFNDGSQEWFLIVP